MKEVVIFELNIEGWIEVHPSDSVGLMMGNGGKEEGHFLGEEMVAGAVRIIMSLVISGNYN